MAPEALSERVYSTKTDVYSFAMTLYEVVVKLSTEIYFKIISKKIPYEELDITQVVLAVCSGKRPTLPSETPEPLVILIKKCWDAQPENRPGIFIFFCSYN